METNEREIILKNLPKLLDLTHCNSKFISIFLSRGIISSEDAENIKSFRVRQERNAKFYDILKTRTNAFEQLLCALNQTNQNGVLSLLDSTGGSQNSKGQPTESQKRTYNCKLDSCTPSKKNVINLKNRSIHFHVQQCTEYFSGRETDLSRLQTSFKSGSTTIICQPILGLGGIGKSELAKRFISTLKQGTENLADTFSIVWLNAENVSKLSFDFRTLAEDKLGISIRNSSKGEKDIMCIVQEVFDFFEDKKCVFVYDNAENLAYLAQFLPNSHSFRKSDSVKPSVLITSRDNNWAMQSQSVINLDVFEIEEAEEYVIKGLRLSKEKLSASNSNKHVNALVLRLGRFPLALTQAISYIQQQMIYDTTYSVLDYLNELGENAKDLLNLKLDRHEQTTYETWNMTIQQISRNHICGKEAIQLLHLLSYLSPDCISAEMFSDIILDERKRRKAILLLWRYSMIKISPKTANKEAQLSIHRLVQEVIRINIRAKQEEKEVLLSALNSIAREVNSVTVHHVISLWNHTKFQKDLVKEYLDIPQKIVSCHFVHYRLNEACEIAESELKFLTHVKKDSIQTTFDRHVISLKKIYCNVKNRIGEYDKPYEIYQSIITDYQQNSVGISDDDELLYVNCLKDYGNLLYNLEKFEEALSIYNQAELKIGHLFSDHSFELVHTQLWRDLLLCYLGKYDKSISCLIDLYKSSFQLPKFDGFKTFFVAHDIVYYLFFVVGNVEDAYMLSKVVYTDMQNYYGAQRVETVWIHNLYAGILNEKKLYDEAFKISLDCYDICKENSVEHFVMLNAKKQLACALLGKRETEQAFLMLSQVMSEMKDPLPGYYFASFNVKIAMAQVLEIKKEYKEAYSYLSDAKHDLNTVLAGTKYPVYAEKIEQAIVRIKGNL